MDSEKIKYIRFEYENILNKKGIVMKTKISRYKKMWFYFIITIVVFNVNAYAQNETDSMTEDEKQAAEILVRAEIGLDLQNYDTKLSKKESIDEDETPFLHSKIKGRKNIWSIQIKDVKLKLKSAKKGYEDKYTRNFTVLIDPNGGNLLKITSICDVNDPDIRPDPNAVIAEKQLISSGERYLGFPEVQTNITFYDALDAVLSNGVGSPFLAKEIDGLYVMDSNMGHEARPVWIITLRGIPAIEPIGPAGGIPEEHMPPVWQLNHMRNVVDAMTGEVLFANNLPQQEKN